MFPLANRKVGGYKFREPTFYSEHHLGTDYTAKTGTPLYAPFDGEIIFTLHGKEGGETIWYKYKNWIIRFMHLSSMLSVGKYKEGNLIGLTGNTGSLTSSPHLHLDISKKDVRINNIDNFTDPEKFDWRKLVDIPDSNVNENTEEVYKYGYDLSHHNKVLDWNKIKTDFIYLKATQGTGLIDEKYIEYQEEIRAKGIKLGHYHFAGKGFLDDKGKIYFVAQDPIKEADWFLSNVDIQPDDYLILDWEIEYKDPVGWCKKFIDRVKEKTGKDCWLYTNDYRALKYIFPKEWKKWIARYKDDSGELDWKYQPKSDWQIWQYTSKGKVDGIKGFVDLNVMKTKETPSSTSLEANVSPQSVLDTELIYSGTPQEITPKNSDMVGVAETNNNNYMEKISKLLKGYKTYTGIAITFLGLLGAGSIISPEEFEKAVNLVMELIGLIIAVYGRMRVEK